MSNDEKIIGLDLDGVIIDHTQSKIDAAKSLGIDLSVSDTPSDVLRNRIEEDAYKKIQRMIYDDKDTAFNDPMIPGAEEGLDAIKNSGFKYFLISRQKLPELTKDNLKYRGLWGKYFNEKNTFFIIEESKREKAKELKVNIYIDDKPSVLSDMETVNQRFLFDPLDVYPNEDWYKKKKTWKEFLDEILN